MIHRIVTGDLRHHSQQTLLNLFGVALAVMIMLTLSGTHLRPLLSYAVTTVFKLTLVGMLLFGLIVDLCFLAINRFSQVREKVHPFAVLRVLGAPPSFFYSLQLQETILLYAAGTVAGVMLTYALRLSLARFAPGSFVFETPYDLWPIAGIVPAGAFFTAGVLATDSIHGVETLDALSQKD